MKKYHLFTIVLIFVSTLVFARQTKKDTTLQTTQTEIDSAALEAELAKELGVDEESSAETPQTQPVVRGSTSRSGSSLNPKISMVGTFFTSATEANAVAKTVDTGLSEAELSLQAYVDPYSKADFFIAFGRESEDPFAGPDSESAANGEYEAELEEAFVTSLSLPFGLQIKAGKFRSNFGKINQTHPHALKFLDLPRMHVNFLGDEGLGDRGLGVNWLVPNPLNFFQELTIEVTSGALNGPTFQGGSNNLLYLGHLKNFFDLSLNSTLELGLSGIYGAHNKVGDKTKIGAVDLTYKWKPLRQNHYKSFVWMTEALISNRDERAGAITSNAFYTFMDYQISKRWFLGGRFDYSEFPDNSDLNEKAYSIMLNFFTTEFQKIELEFQHGDPAEFDSFNRVLLRAVFVIGAHGAHKY